jgi:hypothetical protein
VVMEVRDRTHASEILAGLIAEGLPTTQL